MASIGGTITHSPNTSGSDICWVLFHSSDINPIHQLFCQLPLSGLRGDCSFGGSEYWFILAPHLLLVKFDWIFFFPLSSSSRSQFLWVAYHFSRAWDLTLNVGFFWTPPRGREAAVCPTLTLLSGGSWLALTSAHQPLQHLLERGLKPAHLMSANGVSAGLAWTWPQPVRLWLLTYRGSHISPLCALSGSILKWSQCHFCWGTAGPSVSGGLNGLIIAHRSL